MLIAALEATRIEFSAKSCLRKDLKRVHTDKNRLFEHQVVVFNVDRER